MWISTPWQDNLLRHFLRTGDYWCNVVDNRNDGWAEYGPAILIVGGNFEDQEKLYSIKAILGGAVRRNGDWYTGPYTPWDYLWYADEHTERYLRWLEDKWENHGVIDAYYKRKWVKECLEAFDEDHRNRQDKSNPA